MFKFNTLTRRVIRSLSFDSTAPRILITGGLGQLGIPLSESLRQKYGKNNVIVSDIARPPAHVLNNGPFTYANIQDKERLKSIVINERINWIIHFSALLSAVAENNVQRAIDVSVDGLLNILEIATALKCRLFVPSTIGVFGPESPKVQTPDVCALRPTTIYGVTKVFAELMGEYFFNKYGLDFRSLRLPGIISPDTLPGGGTTDYAVEVFHAVFKKKPYTCFLKSDTTLPMMYISDLIDGIEQMISLPRDKLKRCTYNFAAISFSPKELFAEISKHYPDAKFDYVPDSRQKIADSWPKSLDDSCARQDWGWHHQVDLPELVKRMFAYLKAHQNAI